MSGVWKGTRVAEAVGVVGVGMVIAVCGGLGMAVDGGRISSRWLLLVRDRSLVHGKGFRVNKWWK